MLTLQEMSDRLEITELLARYCNAIDTMQWDLLDELFTEDAVIDYTATGGPRGSLPEQKEFLASTLPAVFQPGFQHLTATTIFDLDGDEARTRSVLVNPMVLENRAHVLFMGTWYVDDWVRVNDRWRIKQRAQDSGWALDLKR